MSPAIVDELAQLTTQVLPISCGLQLAMALVVHGGRYLGKERIPADLLQRVIWFLVREVAGMLLFCVREGLCRRNAARFYIGS
jgi:hypothetical protein